MPFHVCVRNHPEPWPRRTADEGRISGVSSGRGTSLGVSRMKRVQDQTIEGECVTIDDVHFVRCTLINCVLQCAGGEVVFDRTSMRGCRYVFYGEALRTIKFLQGTGLMLNDPAEWGDFPTW